MPEDEGPFVWLRLPEPDPVAIAKALEAVEQGRTRPIDDIIAELEEKAAEDEGPRG